MWERMGVDDERLKNADWDKFWEAIVREVSKNGGNLHNVERDVNDRKESMVKAAEESIGRTVHVL